MSYHGILNADSSLTDISFLIPIVGSGQSVVTVLLQPTDYGPWTYDSKNQLAVTTPPTPAQKMNAFGDKLAVCVALKQSASWTTLTTAQQAKVQAIIDTAAVKILAAIGL